MKYVSLISSGAVLGSSTVIRTEKGFAIQQRNASLSEEYKSAHSSCRTPLTHSKWGTTLRDDFSSNSRSTTSDYLSGLYTPAHDTPTPTTQCSQWQSGNVCSGSVPVVKNNGVYMLDARCAKPITSTVTTAITTAVNIVAIPGMLSEFVTNPCRKHMEDGTFRSADMYHSGTSWVKGFDGDTEPKCPKVNVQVPVGGSGKTMLVKVQTYCFTPRPVHFEVKETVDIESTQTELDVSGVWYQHSECTVPKMEVIIESETNWNWFTTGEERTTSQINLSDLQRMMNAPAQAEGDALAAHSSCRTPLTRESWANTLGDTGASSSIDSAAFPSASASASFSSSSSDLSDMYTNKFDTPTPTTECSRWQSGNQCFPPMPVAKNHGVYMLEPKCGNWVDSMATTVSTNVLNAVAIPGMLLEYLTNPCRQKMGDGNFHNADVYYTNPTNVVKPRQWVSGFDGDFEKCPKVNVQVPVLGTGQTMLVNVQQVCITPPPVHFTIIAQETDLSGVWYQHSECGIPNIEVITDEANWGYFSGSQQSYSSLKSMLLF